MIRHPVRLVLAVVMLGGLAAASGNRPALVAFGLLLPPSIAVSLMAGIECRGLGVPHLGRAAATEDLGPVAVIDHGAMLDPVPVATRPDLSGPLPVVAMLDGPDVPTVDLDPMDRLLVVERATLEAAAAIDRLGADVSAALSDLATSVADRLDALEASR